jgi:hypothetical protein
VHHVKAQNIQKDRWLETRNRVAFLEKKARLKGEVWTMETRSAAAAEKGDTQGDLHQAPPITDAPMMISHGGMA